LSASSRGLGACMVSRVSMMADNKKICVARGCVRATGGPPAWASNSDIFSYFCSYLYGVPANSLCTLRDTPDTKKGPFVGVLRTHYVAMGNMGGLPGGL
jgi:hypothetical protein